jgi:hypothetical protein
MRHSTIAGSLATRRRPTRIQAHLVFAAANTNAEKPKELKLGQTL